MTTSLEETVLATFIRGKAQINYFQLLETKHLHANRVQ